MRRGLDTEDQRQRAARKRERQERALAQHDEEWRWVHALWDHWWYGVALYVVAVTINALQGEGTPTAIQFVWQLALAALLGTLWAKIPTLAERLRARH